MPVACRPFLHSPHCSSDVLILQKLLKELDRQREPEEEAERSGPLDLGDGRHVTSIGEVLDLATDLGIDLWTRRNLASTPRELAREQTAAVNRLATALFERVRALHDSDAWKLLERASDFGTPLCRRRLALRIGRPGLPAMLLTLVVLRGLGVRGGGRFREWSSVEVAAVGGPLDGECLERWRGW